MDIGLFSGSFNPIHIGHLALANYLCECQDLDEVWFMVSPRNPLKKRSDLLDDALRLHLVELAISGYPKFRASDFEFRLPRPSYTIVTLDALKRAYPHHTFHLVIGSDNWALFPQWYESERILEETPLLVYLRPGYPVDTATLPSGVSYVPSPLFGVSSTFIRQALAQGKDVRYFLHPAVYAELCRQRVFVK